MPHSSPLPTVHQPWPFADDPQTQVFITKNVAQGIEVIGTVVHEKGGDWQFLGNADRDESEEPEMICLHCICERDATLMQLHRLKRGQVAIRNSIEEPWEILSYRRYQWLFLPWYQRRPACCVR